MRKINNTKVNYQFIPLEWDTDYFKIKSGKVNIFSDLNKKEKEEIMIFCEKYEFCTISNNNNNENVNYWLGINSKAFITDINLQFEKRDLKKDELKDSTICIENFMKPNIDILDISKNSFEFSRFFCDPNLPKDKSENVYYQWVLNAFNQESKYFVYQTIENKITGFALFSLDTNSREVIIELIAINQKYQSQGVGKKLIHSLENYAIANNYQVLRVGTQLKNIKGINFYQSCGFKHKTSSPIFHLWNK